jgi:hypothetical protein
MRQYRWIGLVSLLGLGLVGAVATATEAGAAEPGAKPKVVAKGQGNAPTVKEALKLTPEGLQLGMTDKDLAEFYDKVLDEDYKPLYKRVPIGPEMKALDAALSEQKSAFRRSVVDLSVPTGMGSGPLKTEFNSIKGEMLMSLNRAGVTRYFFFAKDGGMSASPSRTYKIYDTIPLKEGGELGATFQDAVTILSKRFGVGGRVLAADPAHGRENTVVDWQDATTRIRAIDRSDEKLVALVFENRAASDRLAAIRAQNKSDDGAVDPSIQAITRPGAIVDPNASAADAYTGRPHGPPPGPKGAPGSGQGGKLPKGHP